MLGDVDALECETADRLIRAINDRSMDELLRMCADDVEMSTINSRLLGMELRGSGGIAEWLAYLERAWAHLEGREFELQAQDDWVVGSGHMRGRGKGSSTEIEYAVHPAIRVRRGLVDRIGFFLTREDAERAILDMADA